MYFCSLSCISFYETAAKDVAPAQPRRAIPETTAAGGSSNHRNLANTSPSTGTTATNVSNRPSLAAGPMVRSAVPHSQTANAQPTTASATGTATATAPVVGARGPSTLTSVVPFEVEHKIITIPPKPKEFKNKSTMCRPTSQCVHSQTDADADSTAATDVESASKQRVVYIPIPIPVPIYVPVPMAMYNFPCPVPFPVPVPIPTPVIFPLAPDTIPSVQETIISLLAKAAEPELQSELETLASGTSEPVAQIGDEYEQEVLLLAEALGFSTDPPVSESVNSFDDCRSIACGDGSSAEGTETANNVHQEDEKDLELGLSTIKIVMMGSRFSRKRSLSDSYSTPTSKRLKDAHGSASSSDGEECDPTFLAAFSHGMQTVVVFPLISQFFV